MADLVLQPAAEFQALPLEFIIASPLTAVVKAQSMAAEATKTYIETFQKGNVVFEMESSSGPSGSKVKVSAPFLSIVPVPHLRIDSMTVNFKYEITQIVQHKDASEKGLGIDIGTSGLLSNWISGTLKGSVSHKSSEESTTNRSGTLEITVHASEAPMPEGLAKILSMLSNSISAKP